MIKFVAYSLPGKIMFSALFCRNSSAFDCASAPQSAWNARTYET